MDIYIPYLGSQYPVVLLLLGGASGLHVNPPSQFGVIFNLSLDLRSPWGRLLSTDFVPCLHFQRLALWVLVRQIRRKRSVARH